MTRISKLNTQLLAGSALSFREFQLLLERYGWSLRRIAGSHHIYGHPSVPRPLPITPDGSKARMYKLRQLRDMIEKYGLELDDA